MGNILSRIQEIASNEGITIGAMERTIGASKGVLSRAINNGTDIQAKWLSIIVENYPRYSTGWLLTGAGSMLKDDLNGIKTIDEANPSFMPTTSDDASADISGTSHAPEADAVAITARTKQTMKPIPLVTETAAAGFGNCDFAIAEQDVKDYYVIPKFRYSRVDFMIEVSGLSMHPHFNPGDIIACTILTDRKFLQWNKCHVIATREQGILVKRLMPSKQKNCLTAISDNKDYPPFDIPLDEITGIALVVGSVSLE